MMKAILQKDLIFIEDGNPNESNNMINFEKIYLLGRTLHQFHQSQEMRYHLREIPDIQFYLKDLLILKPKEIAEQAKK